MQPVMLGSILERILLKAKWITGISLKHHKTTPLPPHPPAPISVPFASAPNRRISHSGGEKKGNKTNRPPPHPLFPFLAPSKDVKSNDDNKTNQSYWGRKRQIIPGTHFRNFYDRGDLPISILHGSVGGKITWKDSRIDRSSHAAKLLGSKRGAGIRTTNPTGSKYLRRYLDLLPPKSHPHEVLGPSGNRGGSVSIELRLFIK